jgi:hypothetical protein
LNYLQIFSCKCFFWSKASFSQRRRWRRRKVPRHCLESESHCSWQPHVILISGMSLISSSPGFCVCGCWDGQWVNKLCVAICSLDISKARQTMTLGQ